MKRFFLLPLVLLFGLLQAQQADSALLPKTIAVPAVSISVTVNKTANLVFSRNVINVDRGVEELLVQKVAGAGHILQIKALSAALPETNLSVVTDDLQLYSFVVRYDSNPNTLNYRLLPPGSDNFKMKPPGERGKLNEAQVDRDLQKVVLQKPYLRHSADESWGIVLRVAGIYVHEDMLYLSLLLKNHTLLNYDIESLHISVRDKKKSTRTTNQDIVLEHKTVLGDTALVPANTEQYLVLTLAKFTIPDKKDCIIQLRESNGGRNLECRLRNKQLIRARPVE